MAAVPPPPEALANRNTVYVNQLDARVKIPLLTETLQICFSTCGTIIEIIAKQNIKSHGQAFIVFEDPKDAATAIEELDGFSIFGKKMKCQWARVQSDAVVKRDRDDKELEVYKRQRLAEKERRQAAEAQSGKKRSAPNGAIQGPAKRQNAGGKGTTVPDEYLPPNKTLIVQNIPDDYDKSMLEALFSRFPGFNEVRQVPGRTTLAFIEYEAEEGAISAKERTANMAVGSEQQQLRVTYQRAAVLTAPHYDATFQGRFEDFNEFEQYNLQPGTSTRAKKPMRHRR